MAVSQQKITGFVGDPMTYSDTRPAVPANEEVTIVEFTVPLGNSFLLYGGYASAFTDSEFKLVIGSSVKEILYNNWCTRNVDFNCYELVGSGVKISIKGRHSNHGPHDLNAHIRGSLI